MRSFSRMNNNDVVIFMLSLLLSMLLNQKNILTAIVIAIKLIDDTIYYSIRH